MRIGDVAEVFDGPHATPKKTATGPIFLGITSLDHGRLNLSNVEHLSEEDFITWTRRVTPSPGDVVFSYETRLGEAALIPDGLRCCLGRRMGLVRTKETVLDSRFFLYQYLSPAFQAFLRSRTVHGSTVDRIPLIDFPDFPITVPPLGEQREIAHTLGTLDDKIELNRRMNETLEGIARAIFKSWFVDFDPVRAKANGEPLESICRRLHLTPDLLALFPDRLVDSELGEIPEGWEQKRVDDFMELAYGKALKASDRIDGPVPVYGSGGITGYHSVHLVDGPGIIVGRKGTVGSLYWEDRSFFPIDTVFYVVPKVQLTYCYYLLQTLGLDRMNTDAAVPGLNRNNVYRLPVAWSPDELRQAFDRVAEPLRDRLFANKQESQALENIRETLLPKLLSGELRVPQDEKMTEAIA
ncbi:restriction endonuclease subunit S [Halothiobacillus diazotrophicus]|uniref:restriction endonuclease subunit S n=1 Tax=Halothiobacillus diazotrophicus TaxID=1860122 RepID=UPI0018D3CE04|nr:restriction endonuclease subunit S [Halothiobacillus diazotrophicus]